MNKSIYTFGPFQLSAEQGSLTRDNHRVALGHRAFEILLLLVERAGEVVSAADILTSVWPRTIVEESNLRVHIASLRKALSDANAQAPYILNVPGRGYRFAAAVDRHERKTEQARLIADIPAPLTRLIGRESFVSKILGELSRVRLVTIVGPGGIGKTSVAVAIARELKSRFVDGCHFVDLTVAANPDSVAEAVAEALHIPVVSTTPLLAVLDGLRSRNCALVFDNCEHVIDEVAAVVETILKAAPDVHILATSREPLRAESESVHQLSALEVPPLAGNATVTVDKVMMFSAAALFTERVAALVDGLCFTDSDAPLVAEVCRRLGGIPLAIELAASRVETFGLVGLLDGLSDGLSILTKGRRTAPPRQSSMRATLDWSYGLLNDTEKTVFGRLSVFVDEFTCDAVVRIVPDDYLDTSTVVEALNDLVAKSLVVVSRERGHVAFRLLDLTRQYAFERLRYDRFACDVYRRYVQDLRSRMENYGFKLYSNELKPLVPFGLVSGENGGASGALERRTGAA